MKKTYLLENLGCANCAAKIEQKVAALTGIEEATITFATKQLRITAENPDEFLPEIRKIANSLEPDIQIVEQKRSRRTTIAGSPISSIEDSHEHKHEHHHEHCSCDHGHEHHHEHCSCDHGHEHHHEHCSCDHGHEHHHEHEHSHIPDHPDSCQCEFRHSHEEYCDVCGKRLANCTCHIPNTDYIRKVYLLENLDCANCAAKMEKKIRELPDVAYASVSFATKQLYVTAKNSDSLFDKMRNLCTSIEPDVKLIPKNTRSQNADVLPAKKAFPSARKLSDNTKTILTLISGAVFFVAGEILEHLGFSISSAVLCIASYLILGIRILITAAKNLTKGHVFDENFLMSIATVGAVVIQNYPEAAGVMLFYRIGEFFEHKAVERSRSQIMEAVDMRPETVNLMIGEETRIIPAEEANVGDILMIKPGERIPLDGIIIDGESRIDTSPVTGESVPVKAGYGDEVISGCLNTSGLIKIRVEKVLEESMVTRILDSVENAAASKPKIDRFITRFARVYTPFVVFLALATAIIPSIVTGDWYKWIYTALTFLVISCPCALVLSVPLSFFSGIGAGSKRGILFKGGASLEAMKKICAVIMDKTGTITEGNFVLQKIVPFTDISQDDLLSLCAGCELTSTHPIGNSIVSAAKQKGLEIRHADSVEEIAGHGIRAVFPDGTVLCGNQKLMEKYHVSLRSYHSDMFGTEVLVAKDGLLLGALVISDTIKRDAKSAIAKIKKLGITTVMLTGDAKESADAVAKETGIDEVHAKLLPQEKLDKLKRIRESYGSVMFVGDGINDAPVLAGADVGAAMGSGADAAIEAADVVFMTSNMEAIPSALSIARTTNIISWQNVIFALVVKALVMILGLAGIASMWFAVFADTGVAMLCVLNSIRILYKKDK